MRPGEPTSKEHGEEEGKPAKETKGSGQSSREKQNRTGGGGRMVSRAVWQKNQVT